MNIRLVDYFANWCAPCKFMEPILDELEKEFKNVDFERVNITDSPKIAEDAGVMSIPTFIIEKDGEEVRRIVGAISKEKLSEAINGGL